MRPTRRGVALLLAAVALSAFGWWGPYPLPAALGAAAFAAVLAAPFFAAGGLPAQVSRELVADRVERGRPVSARLRIRAVRRLGTFQVTDGLGGHTRTVTVDGLAAGAEAVHRYELPTAARGRFVVGPLVLHRTDPFGLVRRRLVTADTTVVWVHPRRLPARPATGGRSPHHGGTTVDTLRGTADLQDVREYVPGDEVRHLHWKATARTGRLMVRDLADPQPGRVTVLLDTRARILTPDLFSEAVDVAASLVAAAARAGQRAHLVTPGGVMPAVHGGPTAVHRFLDVLCDLDQTDPTYGPLTPASPASGVSGPPGSGSGGVLVVVTGGGVEVPAAVRRRFGRTVVIALGAADAGAGTAGDAAGAVRLWNERLWNGVVR